MCCIMDGLSEATLSKRAVVGGECLKEDNHQHTEMSGLGIS